MSGAECSSKRFTALYPSPMPRYSSCWILLLLVGCNAPKRFEFRDQAMGTDFRIVLYARDAELAEGAAEAAFARIHELDAKLTDYDPGSELSRLSASTHGGEAGRPQRVSQDLWRVLVAATDVSRASGGAFDVTIGPCVRLWRRSARQGELPTPERLSAARAAVGWRSVRLGPDEGTVTLTRGQMRLDLGGIAKGYALDEALAVLRRAGIERALVDGGGDVAAGAAPPGEGGWRVVLDPGGGPAGEVLLAQGACATSGDAYQAVEIDGRRYSHVVDPRTGLGVTSGQAATVLAPSGMLADAWASALCVLSPQEGLSCIEALPGVEARIWKNGAGLPCDSSGFLARMTPQFHPSHPSNDHDPIESASTHAP